AMSDSDIDTHGLEAEHIGVFGDIRTPHPVAQIVHDLGNATHADAADADEMNGADIKRDAGGHFHCAASLSTRSASLAAASGVASAGASAARAARSSGSAKIAPSIRASNSGVRSASRTRQPAPALARISAFGVWLSSSA